MIVSKLLLDNLYEVQSKYANVVDVQSPKSHGGWLYVIKVDDVLPS